MDNIKKIITGTIITLVIGGTAYTINQADLVNNFANETGLTKDQAEQYINSIPEDEMVPFDEVGTDFTDIGYQLLGVVGEIDCDSYEYEWESSTLSCSMGKIQMNKLANDSILLGESYIKLASDSATEADMRETILLIDLVNADYQYEVINNVVDKLTIDESIKNNSYNKALLKTALESMKE